MPTLRFWSDTNVAEFKRLCESRNEWCGEIDFTTLDVEDPELALIAEQDYGADILPPADRRRSRRSTTKQGRKNPS